MSLAWGTQGYIQNHLVLMSWSEISDKGFILVIICQASCWPTIAAFFISDGPWCLLPLWESGEMQQLQYCPVLTSSKWHRALIVRDCLKTVEEYVLLGQSTQLKCAAYPWAKYEFWPLVNTNFSPFPGQDWVEGLCEKHMLLYSCWILHIKPSHSKCQGQMFSFWRDPHWFPHCSALDVSIWEQSVASPNRCIRQREAQKTVIWSIHC